MHNGKNWAEDKLLPIERQQKTLRQQKFKFYLAILLTNILVALSVYFKMLPAPGPAVVMIEHPHYQKISLPLEIFVPRDARPEISITILDQEQKVIVKQAYLWPNEHCPSSGPCYHTVEILPQDLAHLAQHPATIYQAYPYLALPPTGQAKKQAPDHYELKI